MPINGLGHESQPDGHPRQGLFIPSDFVELIGLWLKVTTLTMQSGQFTTLSQKFGRRFRPNERCRRRCCSPLRLVRGMTEARHQEQDDERNRKSQALPNPMRKQ